MESVGHFRVVQAKPNIDNYHFDIEVAIMSKSLAMAALGVGAILLAIILVGCSDEPSSTPSAAGTAPSPTLAATPAPTSAPTPELASAPEPAATQTAAPTATPVPVPTNTSTPAPAATPRPEPTATPTNVPVPTPTATQIPASAGLSVAAYAQLCEAAVSEVAGDITVAEDEDFTWGDFAELLGSLEGAYDQLSPPQEIQEYHDANLRAYEALLTHARSRPSEDSFIEEFLEVAFELIEVAFEIGFDTTKTDDEKERLIEEREQEIFGEFFGSDFAAAAQNVEEARQALPEETLALLDDAGCYPDIISGEEDQAETVQPAPTAQAIPTVQPAPAAPLKPAVIRRVPLPDSFDDATSVKIGEAVQGGLDNNGEQDIFAFEAERGVTYQIDVELGTLSDSWLALYDSDDAGHTSPLASNDDHSDTLASRIVWRAPSSGEYYVLVESYGLGTGSYTLTITQPEAEAATPAPAPTATPAPAPRMTPPTFSTPQPTATPAPPPRMTPPTFSTPQPTATPAPPPRMTPPTFSTPQPTAAPAPAATPTPVAGFRLTRIGASGWAEPDLAVSWGTTADGTEWVINLRSDARFPDGSPVTAGDAIASILAWIERFGGLPDIASHSQPDDFTLVIRFEESAWDFMEKMSEVEISRSQTSAPAPTPAPTATPAPAATPTPAPTAGFRLVRMGASGLEPDLAVSWSVSDDGAGWTINLRNDARFPDGSPVNAADAIASIEAWIEKSGGLPDIASHSQPDDFTLSIRFEEPAWDFLEKMSQVEISSPSQ